MRMPSLGYGLLLRNIVLPAGDALFRHNMIGRLRYLEKAQWWDRERVEKERNQQFKRLVHIAYNEVPFYRNLFDERGLTPNDLQKPEDLKNLPVVTKAMLRAAYPEKIVRLTGQKAYETASSGSTGANFHVREDAETAGRYRAAFLLALKWAGWEIGDPHVQTGITPSRQGVRMLKDVLLRCHYVSAFDMSDRQLDDVLNQLDGKSKRHLWGYPSSLFLVARHARAKGWNRKLDSIVTWGDNLYPNYRREIESTFGVHIIDTYGCGEGIQIAAQCGAGTDYHIHSLDTIVEFLDDDENPVPAGQQGNVILTRLHPGPMPFLRYAVGDVAVSAGGRMCSCGRGFELLERVEGRDTDIVFTPGGNRLVVHFFTGILEQFPEIRQFKVIQKEPDLLLLQLVLSEDSDEFRERLLSKMRLRGLTDMRVQIEAVAEIPPTQSGKRRFVVREISPTPRRSAAHAG